METPSRRPRKSVSKKKEKKNKDGLRQKEPRTQTAAEPDERAKAAVSEPVQGEESVGAPPQTKQVEEEEEVISRNGEWEKEKEEEETADEKQEEEANLDQQEIKKEESDGQEAKEGRVKKSKSRKKKKVKEEKKETEKEAETDTEEKERKKPSTEKESGSENVGTASPQDTGLKVIVIGGSGAVGKSVVPELLSSPHVQSVTTIGRKVYDCFPESDKLKQVVVTDMADMKETLNPSGRSSIGRFDVGICCLGTTRADAGSDKAFIEVDFTFCLRFAELCSDLGVDSFNLVTAAGSDSGSWLLYPKTKGQLEDAVKKLGFEDLHIYRPGLLDRGKEARFVEKLVKFTGSTDVKDLGQVIAWVAIGQLQDYQPRADKKALEGNVYTYSTSAIKKAFKAVKVRKSVGLASSPS